MPSLHWGVLHFPARLVAQDGQLGRASSGTLSARLEERLSLTCLAEGSAAGKVWLAPAPAEHGSVKP